jgi:hypothetical protein
MKTLVTKEKFKEIGKELLPYGIKMPYIDDSDWRYGDGIILLRYKERTLFWKYFWFNKEGEFIDYRTFIIKIKKENQKFCPCFCRKNFIYVESVHEQHENNLFIECIELSDNSKIVYYIQEGVYTDGVYYYYKIPGSYLCLGKKEGFMRIKIGINPFDTSNIKELGEEHWICSYGLNSDGMDITCARHWPPHSKNITWMKQGHLLEIEDFVIFLADDDSVYLCPGFLHRDFRKLTQINDSVYKWGDTIIDLSPTFSCPKICCCPKNCMRGV